MATQNWVKQLPSVLFSEACWHLSEDILLRRSGSVKKAWKLHIQNRVQTFPGTKDLNSLFMDHYTSPFGDQCTNQLRGRLEWTDAFLHKYFGMKYFICGRFCAANGQKWTHYGLVAPYHVINLHRLVLTISLAPTGCYHLDHIMMTSSNGSIFRVTGHLCGPRWIPCTKASDAGLWCFLWSVSG